MFLLTEKEMYETHCDAPTLNSGYEMELRTAKAQLRKVIEVMKSNQVGVHNGNPKHLLIGKSFMDKMEEEANA